MGRRPRKPADPITDHQVPTPLPRKFEQIVALMDGSDFEPERITSLEKATKLAEDHGWKFSDALNSIRRTKPRNLPPTRAEARAAAEAEGIAAELERERVRDWQISIGPVLKIYGSVEAALAPCRRERALIDAVARWRVSAPPPNERWTKILDGDPSTNVKSPAVIRALKNAYPLPTTISEARIEYSYWNDRGMELALLRQMDQNKLFEALDIVALARRGIVLELLRHSIRAENAHELKLRIETFSAIGPPTVKDWDTLREDIALLAGRELDRTRLGGRRDVRLEVNLALTSERFRDASDRAIARAIGCSPTTVSRARRQSKAGPSDAAGF